MADDRKRAPDGDLSDSPSPHSPGSPTNDGSEGKVSSRRVEPVVYTCRVCLEDQNDLAGLIVPCRCNGSAKYIHRSCLERARNMDGNNQHATRCPTCHFNYQLVLRPADRSPAGIARERRAVALNALDLIVVIGGFLLIFVFIVCVFAIYDNERELKRVGGIGAYLVGALLLTSLLMFVFGCVVSFNAVHTTVSELPRVLDRAIFFPILAVLTGLIGAPRIIADYGAQRQKARRIQIYGPDNGQEYTVRDFQGQDHLLRAQ